MVVDYDREKMCNQMSWIKHCIYMKQDSTLIFGFDASTILKSSTFIVHVSGILTDDTFHWILSSLSFFNTSQEKICLSCLEHTIAKTDD